MGKKRNSSTAATRAWRLLRLGLLWARKGGLLKCKLVAELRLAQKYIKALKPHHRHSRDMIYYGERELSFDETPVIHLRMSRPASLRFKMPCIKPEVLDFDYDFEGQGDEAYGYGGAYNEGRKSLADNGAADEKIERYDDPEERRDNEFWMVEAREDDEEEEEEQGIDIKSEEFIASFYKQMKLQRQISYLQYTEMINRGAN